ncbi:hypothetical protein DL93DRAFT_2072589 [Clavulina sp. PMI_390]|nr:hypothetical protein DL93DRAFT_2072589 [Clavulina sp. PMI_390]
MGPRPIPLIVVELFPQSSHMTRLPDVILPHCELSLPSRSLTLQGHRLTRWYRSVPLLSTSSTFYLLMTSSSGVSFQSPTFTVSSMADTLAASPPPVLSSGVAPTVTGMDEGGATGATPAASPAPSVALSPPTSGSGRPQPLGPIVPPVVNPAAPSSPAHYLPSAVLVPTPSPTAPSLAENLKRADATFIAVFVPACIVVFAMGVALCFWMARVRKRAAERHRDYEACQEKLRAQSHSLMALSSLTAVDSLTRASSRASTLVSHSMPSQPDLRIPPQATPNMAALGHVDKQPPYYFDHHHLPYIIPAQGGYWHSYDQPIYNNPPHAYPITRPPPSAALILPSLEPHRQAPAVATHANLPRSGSPTPLAHPMALPNPQKASTIPHRTLDDAAINPSSLTSAPTSSRPLLRRLTPPIPDASINSDTSTHPALPPACTPASPSEAATSSDTPGLGSLRTTKPLGNTAPSSASVSPLPSITPALPTSGTWSTSISTVAAPDGPTPLTTPAALTDTERYHRTMTLMLNAYVARQNELEYRNRKPMPPLPEEGDPKAGAGSAGD